MLEGTVHFVAACCELDVVSSINNSDGSRKAAWIRLARSCEQATKVRLSETPPAEWPQITADERKKFVR